MLAMYTQLFQIWGVLENNKAKYERKAMFFVKPIT